MGFFDVIGDIGKSIGGAITAPVRVPVKLLRGEKVDAGDIGGAIGMGPAGIIGQTVGNAYDKAQQQADDLDRELAGVKQPEYQSGAINDATLGAIRARQDRAMRSPQEFAAEMGDLNKGLISTPSNLQSQVSGGANIPGLSQVISQRQNEAAERMNQDLMAKNKLEGMQRQAGEMGTLGNLASTVAKAEQGERLQKQQADYNRDLKIKQLVNQREQIRNQVMGQFIGGVAQLGGTVAGFALGGPGGAAVGSAAGGAVKNATAGQSYDNQVYG